MRADKLRLGDTVILDGDSETVQALELRTFDGAPVVLVNHYPVAPDEYLTVVPKAEPAPEFFWTMGGFIQRIDSIAEQPTPESEAERE